jgi:hypothetical protein
MEKITEKKAQLINELDQVPEKVIEEALDFIKFLKMKDEMNSNILFITSESSLRKDWLRPEEDEAWKDL